MIRQLISRSGGLLEIISTALETETSSDEGGSEDGVLDVADNWSIDQGRTFNSFIRLLRILLLRTAATLVFFWTLPSKPKVDTSTSLKVEHHLEPRGHESSAVPFLSTHIWQRPKVRRMLFDCTKLFTPC